MNKYISILMIGMLFIPIRAQPDELIENQESKQSCQYSSQCDAGYYCYENYCNALLPTMTPLPTQEVIEPINTNKPVDTIYDNSIINNEFNDENQSDEIHIEYEDTLIYQEMDECGNVYDAQGNLLWGTGECNVLNDTVVSSQNVNVSNETQIPVETSETDIKFDYDKDTSINTVVNNETDEVISSKDEGMARLILIVGIGLCIATISYVVYVIYESKKK